MVRKNLLIATKMKIEEHFDFAAVLKGPLQNNKTKHLWRSIKLQQVKWIHYKKLSPHSSFYKIELDSEQFLEVIKINLMPKNSYHGPIPISNEK